jgi:hypothetical protein
MNNGVMQPVSRQRIGKHIHAATNTHTPIEWLLETVFPIPSVQSGYKKGSWGEAHLLVREDVTQGLISKGFIWEKNSGHESQGV